MYCGMWHAGVLKSESRNPMWRLFMLGIAWIRGPNTLLFLAGGNWRQVRFWGLNPPDFQVRNRRLWIGQDTLDAHQAWI